MVMITYCFYLFFYRMRRLDAVLRIALAAFALLFAGCETAQSTAPADPAGSVVRARPALSLTPWLSLTGARLAVTADRTGMPSPQTGALAFTRFIRPLALAARGGDLVILDSGAGTAYRYDAALNLMNALRGVPVHPGTQLALGADYSLYVLDQPGRRVLRMGRNGQILASYSDPVNLARPVDVAVDDARGLVIVADGAHHHLVVFHALGGAPTVITLRGAEQSRVQAVGAIAAGPDAIYVSDPLCRCIARVGYTGGVLGTFGRDAIGQPGALAVDRHQRVFVVDQFERALKIFEHARLIDTVPAQRFNMQQIDDVWIDDGVLYVADGLSARVEVLRISVPRGP